MWVSSNAASHASTEPPWQGPLSRSGAEVGDTGEVKRVRKSHSERGRLRGMKRRRSRAAVGVFMHLTRVYTPALHMSSFSEL